MRSLLPQGFCFHPDRSFPDAFPAGFTANDLGTALDKFYIACHLGPAKKAQKAKMERTL